MQPGNQYTAHAPWIDIKSNLGLMDVNFDELKQLAFARGCRDLTMVIMKGNSVQLMRELVGNDFQVVFGRLVDSDVVFESGQGDSIYADTSRVHSTLRVTMSPRPVFELRDEFSLNPHSDRENTRKATRVYRDDGQIRESLIPPTRTTVIESGDIMHFVPWYSNERGGRRNLEFGYSMFVWRPNFGRRNLEFGYSMFVWRPNSQKSRCCSLMKDVPAVSASIFTEMVRLSARSPTRIRRQNVKCYSGMVKTLANVRLTANP